MADIRCGTCASYKPARNEKGNVCPSLAGSCTFEVAWPETPACYGNVIPFCRLYMWPFSGKDCLCWTLHAKAKRARRADAQKLFEECK